ncbi:ABC transporter substrate-binding protein [uncultured Winogradskyella sp.]|uniref:ABC transporter substrate-binding protein n=1 Tax=uncultured Winogradskyella sp. TaxID=395353 RepID=UPI00262CEAB3|nr:ABC transporter substrate-binding protein [uncultured Winogradskyella sp.]
MRLFIYVLLFFAFASCKSEPAKQLIENTVGKALELKYADGFTVKDYGSYVTIKIYKPWPNAKKVFRYAILKDDKNINWSLEKSRFDFVISDDIKKIVVTSTTHIPALELLGVEQTLVGFPGTNYISSKKTRQRIDEGHIRELGKNEGINTEVLLELNPDVVIGFGVDGVNKTFETIKKASIPVIYNGDWVESSALAKAEWIKFFGVLFNKEKEADSIFNKIENDYLAAKSIATEAKRRPTILSGAMHKEVWYMPNGSSAEAQFLKDANVDYLWSNTSGNGSLALNFEVVLDKAKDADIWLNPSYYTSYSQLKEASNLYSNFSAFKNKLVYTFSNTTGATGGVLYYELGTTRPDIVLKDIIKVCHPELLEDYTPYFFKKLSD